MSFPPSNIIFSASQVEVFAAALISPLGIIAVSQFDDITVLSVWADGAKSGDR